jgi:hypothetical protein
MAEQVPVIRIRKNKNNFIYRYQCSKVKGLSSVTIAGRSVPADEKGKNLQTIAYPLCVYKINIYSPPVLNKFYPMLILF